MGQNQPGLFDARFVVSLWLPLAAVAFALISLFPLVRRWLRGRRITFSWIVVARGIGCFAGLWAGGLGIWLYAHGEALYVVSLFGVLGFLLALPWQVITRAWVWWGLFTVLAASTVVPLVGLSWLLIAFIFSTPQPPGSILWLVGGLLSVAFLVLQVFAVWRVRQQSLSYHGD